MLYIGNGFFEECVVVDMSGYCIEVVVLLVVEVYAVSYARIAVELRSRLFVQTSTQCLEYRNVFFEQRNIFCSVVAIVCVGYIAIDVFVVIIFYLPEKGPMDPAGRPSARSWAGVARSSSRACGVP